MYRYSVDQSIAYTCEDIVLFRESPFASWMERLSLENPEHGIAPDAGIASPNDSPKPESVLAGTLRAEGKNVIAIGWELGEAERRTATLAAMRHGIDFIVNGQLAVGPLSDYASLLMRTSGYSELGNYLYIPCDTQLKATLASTFRLCFLADLLHILQGQLPPQMLILRGDSDVVPLQSEDHIYHYRAVKQRFMAGQSAFRKHRMPDPVESAHFGRWSNCANELLKQRALGGEKPIELAVEDDWREEVPVTEVASRPARSAYDLDSLGGASAQHVYIASQHTGTLVEQASMLATHEPALAVSGEETSSLHNLEFIGSSLSPPMIGEVVEHQAYTEPPPASLRNPTNIDMDVIADIKPRRGKTLQASVPFSDSLITNRDS